MKNFLKILLILFIIIAVLTIGARVAGYFFIKNFDIAKYKAPIIQKASEALGRPVELKDISLKISLAQGIQLAMFNFSIGENQDFGTENFVSVQRVDARLDILSLIMQRQISLPNILIHAPQITVIRNAQGLLNVQTLSQQPGGPATPSQGTLPSTAVIPAVLINSFKIENAELHYIDQSIQPQEEITIKKLNLAVRNFSLTNPFDVSLDAAVFSRTTNLTVKGQTQVVLSAKQLKVSDTEASFDLNQLPLDVLKKLSVLKTVPLPQVINGQLRVTIEEAVFSDKGIDKLVMDAALTNGQIAASHIVPGISFKANAINVAAKNFSLNDVFDINASLGYETDVPNIFFNGKATFDMATQNLRLSQATLKTNLSQIPFEQLKENLAPLKTMPLPQVLQGKVEVALQELSAGPKGLTSLKADATLREGLVNMKEIAPGIFFAVSQINANVKNLGLGTPFDFSVELAYLNNAPNMKAKGQATLRQEDQSAVLKDVSFETDLSTLAMEQLKASVASLKNASLPEKLQGKFNLALSEVVAGAKGLVSLIGEGSLKGGEIKMKELTVPIQGLDTNFHLTQTDFTMDAIQARLGKGQITAVAAVKNYLKTQDFTFSAGLKDIDLSEILSQEQAPVKVAGLVFGNLKAAGQGSDLNSITGDGNFEVQQARLKDLNVLKTVLDKISFLPNVSERVQASLPAKYKEKLNSPDTDINKVSAPISILQGAIVLDPIAIEADEFIFSGKCQAGFDQKYNINGAFKIPAELSAAMTQGVADLRYLFDETNQISLPVHATGQGNQAPAISVTQTALDMGKNALRNEGGKQLQKLLNKALGVEEEQPGTSGGQDGQNPQAQPQGQSGQGTDTTAPASPAEDLIKGILDNIFQ